MFNSWEERAVRKFDGIVVVSHVEQIWVRQHAPAARVALVPNGVNVEYFRPAQTLSAPRTIVFTGLMNYPPNVDAVVWFCNAVLPLVARPVTVAGRLSRRGGILYLRATSITPGSP